MERTRLQLVWQLHAVRIRKPHQFFLAVAVGLRDNSILM